MQLDKKVQFSGQEDIAQVGGLCYNKVSKYVLVSVLFWLPVLLEFKLYFDSQMGKLQKGTLI